MGADRIYTMQVVRTQFRKMTRDWNYDDFNDDQSFLSSTLELMVDKLHQYVEDNELVQAEDVAQRIRDLTLD